ncbi:MAG: site-2 protease family protein [Dehalococcoidales bacterium]|nr:site-2 protease family protein [Dehalococcoidales bacterium]
MLVTIVSFFLLLIVLILVHELGHFITAKLSKVKVEEFGIFLPPRLVSFKKGETIYSLNAIPLGGFNKLAGEEDPKAPGGLASKSIPIRLLVLSAGSLMNLILPLILLSISYMIPHLESVNNIMTDDGEVYVVEVIADSPASRAGILPDDTILSVNGEQIINIPAFENIIDLNLDKEITIEVKHSDNTTESIPLTPQSNALETQGAIGVGITTVVKKSYPFWEAIPQGAIGYWDLILAYKDGIVDMARGTVAIELTGPVGIAQMTGEIIRTGFANLLRFAAVISLNLGLVNIFPIPAMDGGRIVFVLIEWVRRGKRISPKTEGMVHTIGFLLLMVAFVIISYHDITRLISGGSLLP